MEKQENKYVKRTQKDYSMSFKMSVVGILPVDNTRCTLNVSNLSAGTYIAHVETAAGISDCKFVVKK